MRRRPVILLTLAALVLATAGLAGAGLADLRTPGTRIDDVGPYAWGVQVAPDGQRAVVPPGTDLSYLTGSRVAAPDDEATATQTRAAQQRAEQSRAWLATGTPPGQGSAFEEMVTDALLDIRALSLGGDGAALAGYNPNWRYVWPRDASFIAAALATSGYPSDAVEVLEFLQDVQHPDGTFEARYLPDGSGPPDGRGIQIDGTGWVLWATDHVLGTLTPGDPRRAQITADLAPLLQRSTTQLLTQVDTADGLPPPSSDYWEHGESELTLGTAAPVLAGLRAAATIWSGDGPSTGSDDGSGHDHTGGPVSHSGTGPIPDADLAAQAGAAANRLHAAVQVTFGPDYTRYPGGADRDAATAFALPPFQPEPLEGAGGAWRASIEPMQRPAGGLAPGAGWAEQSLSWTPQTTLYALTAAHAGEHQMALHWLRWVDAHRTPLGAIPEKVSPDGSPAAVAPLAWSAAMVVLTVAQLEDDGVLPAAS